MPNSWWVKDALEISPVYLASHVFWVIFSITLHELGHGWAALRSGDRTPRELGHMTWNPLVHIPGQSWILFAIFGYAWGRMPVSPWNFRGKYDDAKVSFAGPAMNMGLAIFCALALACWHRYANPNSVTDRVFENVNIFFLVGLLTNTILFFLNLVPIPPLDGSTILANYWRQYREFISSENGAMFGMIGFAVLFIFGSKYISHFGAIVGFWLLDEATFLARHLPG